MKRLTAIFAIIVVGVSVLYAQYPSIRGNATKAANPTVMVMPDYSSVDSAEEIEELLKSDNATILAVAHIKKLFADNSYPTKDFMASVRNAKTNNLLDKSRGNGNKTVQQLIVENSGADIAVYVRLLEQSNGYLNITVEAQEAKIAQTIAQVVYTADFNNELTREDKVNYKLKSMNDFVTQFEDAFAQMVEEGRTINVRITIVPGCDIDPYTEVGTNGNDLETELREWIVNTAKNGSGDISSSDGLIQMEFKVPVYDDNGRPFQPGRVRSILTKAINALIQPLGAKAKAVLSDGQRINLEIANE